ncbi:rolling circle replication-associated protein [Microbacterium kribbense]|uniref:rolling circle replication-associated protein n=1 Tax=Microbacterium kribbense TaxID=433645 RepID=UPI0031D46A62
MARGQAADPDRAAAEAARRARTRLRRYCAGNVLNRLGTLTYRGEGNHDPGLVREHLAGFFRDLRGRLGGEAFPYAWVPEWHKTGHGLHAHFAVGKYIKRSMIEAAWPYGFISIKLLGNLPVGSTSLSEARIAGGYLAKYVAKSFADPVARDLGSHRYDVAEGFQPERVGFHGASRGDVLAQASAFMAGTPGVVWDSSESEDWPGPPTVWAQWGR